MTSLRVSVYSLDGSTVHRSQPTLLGPKALEPLVFTGRGPENLWQLRSTSQLRL